MTIADSFNKSPVRQITNRWNLPQFPIFIYIKNYLAIQFLARIPKYLNTFSCRYCLQIVQGNLRPIYHPAHTNIHAYRGTKKHRQSHNNDFLPFHNYNFYVLMFLQT